MDDERFEISPSGRLCCPRCGSGMNFHAEKIDQSTDPSGADPDMDGVVAQFHTCPCCRYVLERPSPAGRE